MSALKPCPFCHESGAGSRKNPNPEYHRVMCFECEAEGPAKTTEAEAIAAWNHRTTSPSVDSVGEKFVDKIIEACGTGHDYEVRVVPEGTAGWVVNLYPVGGDEAVTGDPGYTDEQDAEDMASSVRIGLATQGEQ